MLGKALTGLLIWLMIGMPCQTTLLCNPMYYPFSERLQLDGIVGLPGTGGKEDSVSKVITAAAVE